MRTGSKLLFTMFLMILALAICIAIVAVRREETAWAMTLALILTPFALGSAGSLFHRTIAENLTRWTFPGIVFGFAAGLVALVETRPYFLDLLPGMAFRIITGRPAGSWYEIALGSAILGAGIGAALSLTRKRYPDAAGR